MATPEQISANRENAKLGGRPKSFATLQTQKQREILIKQLETEAPEIFKKLIAKAKSGDVQAAKEIFDRAYGKAPMKFEDDAGENVLPLLVKIIGDESNGDTNGV